MLKLSKTAFILINTILLTLLNLNLFLFFAKNLNDLFLTFMLVVCYFCIVFTLLNLIFIKYFTKLFSILFITSATFSVYFMSSYGILIDSDMILNVMQTDAKEALELFNTSLIFIGIACLAFCLFVLKIEIKSNSTFKRFLSSCVALILALAVFLPFTKAYIPFFRNYKIIKL